MQRGLNSPHTDRSIDQATEILQSVASGDAAAAGEYTDMLNSALF